MEINGKHPQMPKKLLNELRRFFNKNICFGLVCNDRVCFC